MTKLLQLDEIDYKDDLYTLISDPSLVGDARRSKRINLNKLPAKGRIWDITPIVSPMQTPDLEFNDLFQMNLDADQLSIDQNSPLINVGGQSIYKHGCAKTNINLGMLNDGDSWHVGFRIVTNGTGYCLNNLMFYDKNATASSLAAAYLNGISNGGAIDTPTLILSANRSNSQLTITGSFYNPVADSYVTTSGSFPFKYLASDEGSNNNTSILLLNRDGNTLNIVIAAVDTAGNYDIHELHQLGNDIHPFPFDDLAMFIYAGTVMSPQIEYQVISPTLRVEMPSYDVTNTVYALHYGGTQIAFDEIFDTIPHRPSGVTVTQSEFPEGVMVGEYLNTYLDPDYNGVAPKPYGILVSGDKTVVVTSVTLGNEGFELLVRGAEFAQLASTVANISNNSMQSLFYGEIVVYVNNDVDNVDLFTGDRSFNTFDAAYDYLISLPRYMPKRIVMDDRPLNNASSATIYGSQGRKYNIGENNIKLSTYCAFSGEPYPKFYNSEGQNRPDPNISPTFSMLNMEFDSVHLVDFWGSFLQNITGIPVVSLSEVVDTQTSPTYAHASNLRLGKNTVLWGGDIRSIGYDNGGSILLEEDSFLQFSFGLPTSPDGETPLYMPFDIYKSAQSRLHISANGGRFLDDLPYDGSPYQMRIYYPENGNLPVFDYARLIEVVDVVALNYPYAPLFTIDNVVMVRNLTDFKPDYDYSGLLVLPTTAKTFFIVGTVNLGSHVLYGGSGSAKHHFMGFPDSKLVADSYILRSNSVNSSQSFKFSNLQLETLSVGPEQTVIRMESGGLDITDCIIDAPAGVWYIANEVPENANTWPINVKSTEFKSNVRTPGSIIRLNSYCNVAIRDVTYSGEVFPSQPVMDIRGLYETAHVIVDGFTVIGNDESISSPLFIVDDLERTNGYISVKGVHVTHGNINVDGSVHRGLFTQDYLGTSVGYYSPYNHVQDNRIVTENSRAFMIFRASAIVTTVSNTFDDNVFNLNETEVGPANVRKYGFINATDGAQTYLLNEHMLHEIRLKADVAAGANLTLRFKIKRLDDLTDEEHDNDFVEVTLDGNGTGTIDALYYRELACGGTYALVVQNLDAPINVAITDVVFTIRVF